MTSPAESLKSEIAPLLPTGIYTIPEASCVGDSEQSLVEKEIPYLVGRAHYRDTPRGQIMGDEEGFLKLLFHRDDLRLLDVHVMGEHATELVHVGLIAMMTNATADLFNRTCFDYPTPADLYKYAAYATLSTTACPAFGLSGPMDVQKSAVWRRRDAPARRFSARSRRRPPFPLTLNGVRVLMPEQLRNLDAAEGRAMRNGNEVALRRRLVAYGSIGTTLALLLLSSRIASAALELAVVVNPDPAVPGEQVSVELTVSNDGVGDETGLQLQLVFPAGLVSYSEGLFGGAITTVSSCTGGASNAFCEPGELIVFVPGLLAPGASVPASVPGLTPMAPPGSVPGSLL